MASNDNPIILIDKANFNITIEGNSLPENPLKHYNDVFFYLNEVEAEKSTKMIQFNIKVELFNSSSIKTILEIFSRLNELKLIGIDHKINWFYIEDEEESREKGELVNAIVPVNIDFIPY
jgi:hypothetical protein